MAYEFALRFHMEKVEAKVVRAILNEAAIEETVVIDMVISQLDEEDLGV